MFYHVFYIIDAQGYPIFWDMTVCIKLNVFPEKKLRIFIINEYLQCFFPAEMAIPWSLRGETLFHILYPKFYKSLQMWLQPSFLLAPWTVLKCWFRAVWRQRERANTRQRSKALAPLSSHTAFRLNSVGIITWVRWTVTHTARFYFTPIIYIYTEKNVWLMCVGAPACTHTHTPTCIVMLRLMVIISLVIAWGLSFRGGVLAKRRIQYWYLKIMGYVKERPSSPR